MGGNQTQTNETEINQQARTIGELMLGPVPGSNQMENIGLRCLDLDKGTSNEFCAPVIYGNWPA